MCSENYENYLDIRNFKKIYIYMHINVCGFRTKEHWYMNYQSNYSLKGKTNYLKYFKNDVDHDNFYEDSFYIEISSILLSFK